jgi:hypothetical protein
MEEVTIKISPDGTKVEVDADGFSGPECMKFMSGPMSKLGSVLDEKKKPEFHQVGGSGLSTKV